MPNKQLQGSGATFEQQLPENLDAERFVLGAIMTSETGFIQVAGTLFADDFSLEKHRRIFLRMGELHDRGEKIDRVTLANELIGQGQLNSVDGLSYLVSLDDGLPSLSNLDSYVAIVKEKSRLRRLVSVFQDARNSALESGADSNDIAGSVENALLKLSADSIGSRGLATPARIIQEYEGGINAFLDSNKRTPGIQTGFLKFDEMTGGLREGELFILAARPSVGKAQPLVAPVKTLSGWTTIGELKIGDPIASIDGHPSHIDGIYPQGKLAMFRVTFSDGRSTKCCAEHLWEVHERKWRQPRILSTFQLKEMLKEKTHYARLRIRRPTGEFGNDTVPLIDPWLLGYVIGNGCMVRGLRITIPDQETVNRVASLLGAYECKLEPMSTGSDCIDYRVSSSRVAQKAFSSGHAKTWTIKSPEEYQVICGEYVSGATSTELSQKYKLSPASICGLLRRRAIARRQPKAPSNGLVVALKAYGIYGKHSVEKFIPHELLNASKEIRLELLAGLMDSDGTAEKNGAVSFCSTSYQLAENVQYLIRSLGGMSAISPRKPRFTYKGVLKEGLAAYNVSAIVDTPGDCFKLARKKSRAVRRSQRRPRLSFKSIELEGEAEACCISVTHPSHTYITNDFIVTHNTALALNISQHVATNPINPKAVAVFSLEMSRESLLTRMVCASARVDQQRFRAGYLNAEERLELQDALYKLNNSPLYIDDTAGTNLMDVHSKVRRLQAEHDVGLVVIDYLQLIQGRGRFENRVQEVSSLSRGLKLMAKELRVPFLVLSQLSRAPETRVGDHRPMLSDLRESGCLTGDTLIACADTGSRIPISQVKPGMSVWALNESTFKLERARVSSRFSSGVKRVFTVKTQLGRTIRATATHPFRTWEGWKPLQQIKRGEHIAIPRKVPTVTPPIPLLKAEIALLGHMLGNGCMLPRHAIQYTSGDYELCEIVASLARTCFGDDVAPRISSERSWFQVYLASTRRHTHGVHSAVADWLRSFGLFGKRSYEKFVPDLVFQQTAESIAWFLRNLWCTDGSLSIKEDSYPAVAYGSSSYQLASDVQALLLRIGIQGRLLLAPQMSKGRPYYHVIVSGKSDILRFCNVVGTVGSKRQAVLAVIQKTLADKPENTNRDVIPAKIWRDLAVPSMRAHGITTREMMRELKTAYCGTQIYKQNLGRERALRVAAAVRSEAIKVLACSDVYWDRIASVDYSGEEEVFDLSIPGHHNFVANDLIPHNSLEQDSDLVAFIFREEIYRPDKESLKGIAELILAKQRNGPTGIVKLAFLKRFTKFENMAMDLDQQGAFE